MIRMEVSQFFFNKWMLLVGIVLTFHSCVNREEEPPKIEIPVDTYWMYSSNCLRENFEKNFLNQQTLRITDKKGFEVLVSCSVELPEIDFNEFFLSVTRIETMKYPNFRDQGLYLENETELVYKINIDLSDFNSIGIIYCFGVIPIDFSQDEIRVQVIEH
ncbi:hypothetical protein [Cyclobacterium plantarum]|uniref:hypothetical protein n=1 Tax=Cyclobacterium plantarum TaxID=2716263 RepID=UPI003F6FBE71